MKSRMFLLTGIALLTWLPLSRGDGGHEPGQSIKMSSRLDPTASFAEQCDFSTELEPVTFKLTSFKDKYKVVRIRVENRKGETIKLAAEKDAIELVLSDGKVVKGTFNLQMLDGPLWDSLSDDLRNALAYPLSIRAAKVADGNRAREEVVYFFAFFPAENVPGVPRAFHYTIESLGKTLTLEERAVAKE